MSLTAHEIVRVLGGTNATARFFGVRPPSVSGWLERGAIPDDRLITMAASLEAHTAGRFSRKRQWPDRYLVIWPELV